MITKLTSKESDVNSNESEEGLPIEVEAFEKTFQKIQDDYERSLGSGKKQADKERLKV